jgi:hypothetical protein
MRHAVSKELYAYWRALGRGGCAPERNAVEPSAIRGVLADTFVLDFDPAAGFPLRISGSRINAVFLTELRGASFLKIWRDTDRAAVAWLLQAAADGEAPYWLLAQARPAGLAPVEIEVTLLPLRHRGSTHARMLGSLTACAGAEWVGLVGSGPAALTAWREIEPAEVGALCATLPLSAVTRLSRARDSRSA